MNKQRNVYMVWTEEYYQFIVAHSHSHAKYLYFDFGDCGWQAFDKQPKGFWISCQIVEHNVPFECGVFDDYAELAGVDLMLSGVLLPMYMCDGFNADDEYDYHRWNGFRKPKLCEMELSS